MVRSPRCQLVPPLAALLASAILLAGCGGGGGTSTPAPPPVDPWAAVDATATQAFNNGAAAAGVSGMTLAIYDRNDRRVFVKTWGDFAPDRRVPVASASKLVSGVVLLRLVGQGLLSLDSSTGQVLGWSGPRGAITLRHLLSFTSGLDPDAPCTSNPLITLAACVDAIRDDPAAVVAAPGTRFDYGSTHLHVAARMAEVVTGKAWNTVFAEQLRQPLGLPAQVTYYTFPQQATGQSNPLVAGGLWTSVDEYAQLLAIPFQRGSYRGTTWAPAALFDAQAIEPFPGVTIGNSPMALLNPQYRYGLAAWLECSTPAAGCSTLSSPGAFGFTPWFDRDAGYYAVLGMLRSGTASTGVVAYSVNLAQQLKPQIRSALAAR